jgi:Flp pilus assembly protein CpaB
MDNKKNLISLLAIAFVVAVLATALFYGLVVNKLNDAAEANRDQVAVAARDLAPGERIAPDDVKWVSRSDVDALVDGVHSERELLGLSVGMPVREGEALERRALVAENSKRGAALGIAPGLRAVSVHVADSTGLVQLMNAGHRVDVQLVSENGRGTTTLRTILQNLEVLRVEKEAEASENRPVLPVVTLLATPEEADALAMADAAARIRLLLRHPLDTELTERSTLALAEVLSNPPKQTERPVGEGEVTGEKTASDEVETARRRVDPSAGRED